MKIGILQTGHAIDHLADDHGDFDSMFRQLLNDQGFDFKTYAVLDGAYPESVTDCDGWLITGSRFSSYEKLPWIPAFEEFLRAAYAANAPIVGICFGHQILAQALGGKVEKSKKGWGLGPHEYKFDGIKESVVINAWHQDQVTELPKGARTIGRSEFCENAAIIYGDTAYTVQAHPEFTNDFTSDLINARRSMVPETLVAVAEERLKHFSPSPEAVAQIISFFKTRNIAITPAD